MNYLDKFPGLRITADILLVIYLAGVAAVVFFPLPAMVNSYSGYHAQLIPFRFVYDIAKEKSLRSVMQVLLNIVLTIPFGMFMQYRFGVGSTGAMFCALGLSLAIEVGQLTGLFFMYPFSYRLFDVDDLMLNALGGFLGAKLCDSMLPIVIGYLTRMQDADAVAAQILINGYLTR